MHRGNLIHDISYAKQSDDERFKKQTPPASRLMANHISSYFADSLTSRKSWLSKAKTVIDWEEAM